MMRDTLARTSHVTLFVLFAILLASALSAPRAAAEGADPAAPAAGPIFRVFWTRHPANPVLNVSPAPAWDNAAAGLPSVVLRDGVYHMWYTGGSDFYTSLRIGHATSLDGVSWQKSPGAPVFSVGPAGSWDSVHVAAPHVIYHNGLYRMWYRGTANASAYEGAAIGYATSPDGLTWTRQGSGPVLSPTAGAAWDAGFLWSAYVLPDGTGYRMWYSGCLEGRCRVGLATSPDGLTWTRHPANPVLDLGPSGAWDSLTVYYPSVLSTGTGYEMWYTGFNTQHVQLGHATSSDGITWTRAPDNPILTPGETAAWDGREVFAAAVLPVAGATPGQVAYRMWYTGSDGAFYRTGLAEGRLVVFAEHIYLPITLR